MQPCGLTQFEIFCSIGKCKEQVLSIEGTNGCQTTHVSCDKGSPTTCETQVQVRGRLHQYSMGLYV